MIIETFVLTPFQQNTRVVVCEQTRAAICIDPGESSTEIVDFLQKNDFQLQAIALTHAHLDHIGGVSALHGVFPNADTLLLKALGLDYEIPPPLTRNWQDGEIYAVGSLRFEILHCPGHTPGHIIFAEKTERKVFVGDCLFEGSIGRTDLPGGNSEQLINSINRRILPLGDDFTVYTGHGNETTIGFERATNPFLTGVYQI
jgi:hydroxyacylglutathione hydrolase